MTDADLRQLILYKKDVAKKRATITFNRPEKLNSVDTRMYAELIMRMREVEDDDDVMVVVLKGAGRCFGTGHDLADLGPHHGWTKDPLARRPSQRRRLWYDDTVFQGRRGICQAIAYCNKATIAQVHGYCYGGHLPMVMACDMAVASEDASFTHPGYRYIGAMYELVLWMHTMGLKKAKEMTLTGRQFGAAEALECGLVNCVVPADRLEAKVDELASRVADNPRDAVVLGKFNWQIAMDIAGIGASYTAGTALHTFQTNIRYEADEFNLFKAKRDSGISGAIGGREEHFKASKLARK